MAPNRSSQLQGWLPAWTSTSDRPLELSNFPTSVQDALYNLRSTFEEIDAMVESEFDNPQIYSKNFEYTRSGNTKRTIGPIEYNSSDQQEFKLMIANRAQKPTLQYLAGKSYPRSWPVVLSKLNSIWEMTDYQRDFGGLATKMKTLESLSEDLPHYFLTANERDALPSEVKFGIKLRIKTLDGFLDTAERILKDKDHENYASGRRHTDLFPKRVKKSLSEEGEDAPGKEPRGKHHSQTRRPRQRWLNWLTSDSTVIGCTCIVPLTGAVLQVITFKGHLDQSPNSGSTDAPKFLSSLQQCFMQLLGLFGILVPSIRDDRLRSYIGFWTLAFSAASIALSLVSPLVCSNVNQDWSDLLLFFGNAAQAFVGLQLIQGLKKAAEPTRSLKLS